MGLIPVNSVILDASHMQKRSSAIERWVRGHVRMSARSWSTVAGDGGCSCGMSMGLAGVKGGGDHF